MMSSADEIAREAAQRLAPELDRTLPALVEAQLQSGNRLPERYDPATAIALATLLLNVAKFGWDIYRERKKDAKPISSEALTREIRIGVRVEDGVSTAQRDKIISVVAEEICKKD